ncbi:MAG: sulfatase-like hydrolase/transferase [Candidatus Omnitrophota bacterium]
MFARKIKNHSGSVSVQVVRKEQGRYRVVRAVGTAKDGDEIERLWRQAQHFVRHPDPNQGLLFAMQTPVDQAVQSALETLSNASIRTIGPELIFGTLFDRIGFHQIPDELFRHLVLARLAYPASKLKTVDYLRRYRGMNCSVSAGYKFLDRLHSRYKSQAEKIAYEHTRQRLGSVSVVFYDMTTLYFEAEALDKRGWLDRTLIVFTSDHGDMTGDHNLWRKSYPYEPSARIPMLLRWPAGLALEKRGRTL